MKSILLFSVLFASTIALQSSLWAQSEKWENSLISHNALATLNLNVSRLCQTYKDSEVVEKVENMLKDRQLNLAEIDQFQGVILSDAQLGLGADNSSHTQLTFLEATDFDAETVGKHTRYKLHPEKIKTWDAFLGDPKREGNWGAIAANDRTLVYGVTRMLKSIVASQDLTIPKEHGLSNLRKQDVDICITLSGGDKIHDVFEDAWRTDQFRFLFSLVDHGLIYFDGQAETQLVAELFADSETSAEDLESALKDLIKPTVARFRKQMERYDRMIESFKAMPNPDRMLEMVAGPRAATKTTIKALTALKISRDGVIVQITGADESIKALPETLIGMIAEM